ncbi:MAG: hypothetical protein ACFCBW_00020, partial [Candidatus Competibacterales bacterium]
MPVQYLIYPALGLVLFAGLEGGKYFMNNRLQELGLAALLGLFGYGALHQGLADPSRAWGRWFWTGPLLAGYIMVSAAGAFALNAGAAVVPSVFASRYFIFILIAPTLYFLTQRGLAIEAVERTFLAVVALLLVNYVFFYHTLDLRAAFFSTGYLSYLVTWDEWRGFRLKPPTFALVIATVYGLFRLVRRDDLKAKLAGAMLLGLAGYIWSLLMARAQMATIALALLLYPVFLATPRRFQGVVLAVPLGVLALGAGHTLLLDHFLNAEGAHVRAAAYGTAWETFLQHPVVGYGQSSGYSKTYQDLFGAKFFPSDLGLVGIAFKYGGVGVALYLFCHGWVTWRLLRTHWLYRRHYRRHNPLLWALLLLMTALSLNIVINPGHALAQGLTVDAFAVGLTQSYKDLFAS